MVRGSKYREDGGNQETGEQKGPREQYLFKDRPRESTLTEGGKNKKDLGKVQGVCTQVQMG